MSDSPAPSQNPRATSADSHFSTPAPPSGMAPYVGGATAPTSWPAQTAYPLPYKDATAAYLLWFFLGGLGAHKFYLRSPGLGVLYICLLVFGWATAWLIVGVFLLLPLYILLLVDAFLIPGRIREINASTYANNARLTGH